MFQKIMTPVLCLILTGCAGNSGLSSAGSVFSFGDSIPSEGRFIEDVDFTQDASLSYEERQAMRRKLEANTLGIAPLAVLTAYAQEVLDRIINAAPDGAPRAQVHLIANQSPGARAVPSGDIYLNHSIFDYVENEDQLAFFLAHEYSHVVLEHSPEGLIDRLRPYLLTAADVAISTTSQDDRLGKSIQLYGSDIVARDVIVPVWDRKLEREADLLGVDLMSRAGYNPSESIRMLLVLKQQEESFEMLNVRGRNALEKSLADSYSSDGEGGIFDQALAKFGEAVGELQQDLSRRHDSADERMKDIYTYTEREYREENSRPLSADNFEQEVAQNDMILEHYRQAFLVSRGLAGEAGVGSDMSSLQRMARVAVSGTTTDHPYTRDAYSKLRASQGRYELALQNLSLAHYQEGYLPFPMELNRWQWSKNAGRDEEKALDRLMEAGDYYDWPLMAYNAAIPSLKSQGKEDRAMSLEAECLAKYPQNREMCG